MIEAILVRPYALPLKSNWRAASAMLSMRSGLLFGIESECWGQFGWNDCAQLPSSGAE